MDERERENKAIYLKLIISSWNKKALFIQNKNSDAFKKCKG